MVVEKVVSNCHGDDDDVKEGNATLESHSKNSLLVVVCAMRMARSNGFQQQCRKINMVLRKAPRFNRGRFLVTHFGFACCNMVVVVGGGGRNLMARNKVTNSEYNPIGRSVDPK